MWMADNSDELLVGASNAVATLTFNRPASRNALNPDVLKRLITALARCDRDASVRVVVLRGAEEVFSSGGDLAFLQTLMDSSPSEIRKSVYSAFQGAVRAVRSCSKPVVAAVHGPAVGAGCEIAVACDFRIASTAAIFHENWIDIGLMPALGGLFLLPRLIGLGRATDMMMRGVRVGAEEAKAIGLVSDIAPPERFEDLIHSFSHTLATKPPSALAAMKIALLRGTAKALDEEMPAYVDAQLRLITGADFASAMTRIRARRRPDSR
jgi:enoyl-CoA hydratase/carnithine racemase